MRIACATSPARAPSSFRSVRKIRHQPDAHRLATIDLRAGDDHPDRVGDTRQARQSLRPAEARHLAASRAASMRIVRRPSAMRMSAAIASSIPSSIASPLMIATVGFESTAIDSTRLGFTSASKPATENLARAGDGEHRDVAVILDAFEKFHQLGRHRGADAIAIRGIRGERRGNASARGCDLDASRLTCGFLYAAPARVFFTPSPIANR